ncbi:syntaxin-51-like [Silene latifolia]|uniref:syntaxin-51-like n=1 Tax=Silene latifolia TaxID=37657 RepID=UPI003D77CEC1
MALTTGDSWMKEYNEAAKLTDEIDGMIADKTSTLDHGSESKRHLSTVRRKITILGTRLDSLEALLAKLPSKQSITEKELNRRKDMLSNLRSKAKQMANTLNMSNFGNKDMLLGPEVKSVDAMSRIAGLDNQGIVGLQRQIMREQDEGLDQLEESVLSTKHIALAVNEELDLHTRLLDTLDRHVEVTGSRLQSVARSLALLNRRTKESCSCSCLVFSIAGIVILFLTICVLIKYL